MGTAQIWALSYFEVAGAFLASLVERLLSVCRRPHRGRSAPLPIGVLHDPNVCPVVVRAGRYRIHDSVGTAHDIKGNGESFVIAIESSYYRKWSHQESYSNTISMDVEYRYIALADHLPTVVALEDQPLFVYSTDGGPAGEGVLTAKVEYLAAE